METLIYDKVSQYGFGNVGLTLQASEPTGNDGTEGIFAIHPAKQTGETGHLAYSSPCIKND